MMLKRSRHSVLQIYFNYAIIAPENLKQKKYVCQVRHFVNLKPEPDPKVPPNLQLFGRGFTPFLSLTVKQKGMKTTSKIFDRT